MDFNIWLTFVAASTALLFIPGPTVLLVLSYAISHGRRVAVATAAGVAFGDLVAMTASLAGLGALVLASATLFTLIKWIGAAYLVWLGMRLILGARKMSVADLDPPKAASPHRIFGHAAAVTALNPKSIVFFIAFVPQFIRVDMPLIPQFAILVATFVTLAALNALAYAVLADQVRARIARPAILVWLARIGGGALIGMGVLTAAYRRAS